jgi:hypothetical protein
VAVWLVAGAAWGNGAKPLPTVIDARYQAPYGTILRGHAGDSGGIAKLLEDLGRPPGTEEPILREMSRSGRGYEFIIVVPFGPGSEEDTPRRAGFPKPPRFFAEPWIGKGLEWLFSPAPQEPLPARSRPFARSRAAPGPGRDTRPAAGERSFAGLSIDDIAVEAIYMTSVGGVVAARAHGRRFLLRDGDRLADGDIQGIAFSKPTVAWVRFRQRDDSTPGFPYRPVVWLLTARDPGRSARRQEPGGGLAIGGSGGSGEAGSPPAEIRKLSGAVLDQTGWKWAPPMEQAPRVAVKMSRRDPFLDLSDRTVTEPQGGSPHPSGVPGLLIDEFEVTALFMTPAGPLAEIRTPTDSFFFLREGDQLFDGDVVRIDPRAGVIFKQIELDPTALKPFRSVVKTIDPRRNGALIERGDKAAGDRWPGTPAGTRDPFHSPPHSPRVGEAFGVSRSPVLDRLTCSQLNDYGAEERAAMLERAGRRLARYWWERGLLAGHRDGKGAWERRFLDDVADAASADLARLLSLPFNLGPGVSLHFGPTPPPAEMFALLGDSELLAGRLPAAAESYRLAEELHPGQTTHCGHLFAGRLYGVEGALVLGPDSTHWSLLTGYLLAWDLASGRVVERHPLPAIPVSLAAEPGELQIALEGGGTVRIAGPGLAPQGEILGGSRYRYRYRYNLMQRYNESRSGALLTANFAVLAGPVCSWQVRRRFDERLPLDLPELEKASRAAAARDPTRPWHSFFHGQALWAQGRRKEAEAVWDGIWSDTRWSASYRELVRMAAFHERCGQSGWADRVFAVALAQRRRLSRVTHSYLSERLIMTSYSFWPSLRDPERRYLWWRRLREVSGIAPGDAFRAVIWADERRQRGDRLHAQDELSFMNRSRLSPRDTALQSAWLDYTVYAAVACAAMLFAQSAVLGRRTIRWFWRRRAARPLRHGPAVLLLAAAFYLALSLAALAMSQSHYLHTLPFEPGDVPAAGPGAASDEDRLLLTSSDLLYAWLTTGVLPPENGGPFPLLLQRVREIRSLGTGVQVLLGLAGIATIFVLALPAGLFLQWGQARAGLTRWVPGAAQVRAGARLQGYVLFGLFVFAVVPLAWLVLARTCGPVPAPGPISAFFFNHDLEGSPRFFLPLLDPESLRSRLFFQLLAVYPQTGLFWSLVTAALAVSLGIHAFGRR